MQILTIWRHSYKGAEWKPCTNRSSGGISYVFFFLFSLGSLPVLFSFDCTLVLFVLIYSFIS